MITLLRPGRESELLLTAEAFETLFSRHLGPAFSVRRPPLVAWCQAVLGPPRAPFGLDEAGRRLAEETRGVDFLCPNYELIPFAPLLLAARNRAGARVRLLFISHASGSYGMEWALLAPLMAPGDRIVAPSHSARRAIEMLCPALSPFIRVIHHPMEPLPAPVPAHGPARVVSLGRIQALKLLHRQVDAMAVLRSRGRRLPRLEMAGALADGGWQGGEHPYVRGLRARIRRHGLQEHVHLVGPVRGDARGAFLAGARMMLNLSVTVEESFPKAPVEAAGVGVPVLATAWDGLHESVGAAGLLLPLHETPTGGVDVSAEAVADGMERLLDAPPSPEACRAHAEQYRPTVSVPVYRRVLHEALAEAEPRFPVPAAPAEDLPAAAGGELGRAAPLTAFSWGEMFELYRASCARLRAAWAGEVGGPEPGDHLRMLLDAALRQPLERLYAGLPSLPEAPAPAPAAGRGPLSDFFGRLGEAGLGGGLPAGRVACLATVAQAGRAGLLRAGIERLEAEGAEPVAVEGLRAELALKEGDPEAAFLRAAASLRALPAGENDELRVRRAGRMAREWGRPALALPLLREWLERFPDSQESGPVWLDLALTAHRAGDPHSDLAAQAWHRAHELLGDIPAVLKVRGMISVALAHEVLA